MDDKQIKECNAGRFDKAAANAGEKAYELTNSRYEEPGGFQQYHCSLLDVLKQADRRIFDLLAREHNRLSDTLQLIAAENRCSRQVLAALGSIIQNKTTEGFPGARLHGGSEVADDIERLAVERARNAFGACYANVQPHSGTTANQIVIAAVLKKGGKILSMAVEQGGHFSHGDEMSIAGRFFDVENYFVNKDTYLLDYDAIREKALNFRPGLIICGASAYSRAIDFARFRQIADEVGSYLLADVSHIAGLIMAGAHQSAVNYAHFTTTSTYKPGGPRGGLVLMGKDYNKTVKIRSRCMPLWKHIEQATFPGVQGTAHLNNIAAKAVFFKEACSDEYRTRQFRIIENANALAESLLRLGCEVLTGGTDNHMVLVDVSKFRQDLTGLVAQKALEECGVVVSRIRLAYDEKPLAVTSGIRLGSPIVTRNGMGTVKMAEIAEIINDILKAVTPTGQDTYRIAPLFAERTKRKVKNLCRRFPLS